MQNDRKGVLSKRGFGGSDFDIEILYFSYIILFSLRFSKVFPSKPLEGKTFENLRKNKIMYEKYKIPMSKSDPTKPCRSPRSRTSYDELSDVDTLMGIPNLLAILL